MFDRLRAQFSNFYDRIAKTELKGKDLDNVLDEFQLSLIENDVAVSAADFIGNELREKLKDVQFARLTDPRTRVKVILQEVLLPPHGIELVIRQCPEGAQVAQGPHVFEPGSERRVPGIRTPTRQFTESAQHRFCQAGDTGLGQQHGAAILRPLVKGA